MIKQAIDILNLSFFAQAALVIFFGVFVSIVLWALFKPKKVIQHWAELPLEDPNEAFLSTEDKRSS